MYHCSEKKLSCSALHIAGMGASVMCSQQYFFNAIPGSFLCQVSEHWLVWIYLALQNKGWKTHWFLTRQAWREQSECSISLMSLPEWHNLHVEVLSLLPLQSWHISLYVIGEGQKVYILQHKDNKSRCQKKEWAMREHEIRSQYVSAVLLRNRWWD